MKRQPNIVALYGISFQPVNWYVFDHHEQVTETVARRDQTENSKYSSLKIQIRFIVSDRNAQILNNWLAATQSLTHCLNAMAMVGIPPPLPHSSEFTVIHGLRAAVEALTEPSEQQKARIAAKRSVINRCRVICITSARDDDSMMSLEEIFMTVVGQQNRVAVSKGLLKIDQCHLVVINLHPTNLESLVSSKPLRDLNGVVRSEVHTVRANEFSSKLTHLILRHYDLASTTVTGKGFRGEYL